MYLSNHPICLSMYLYIYLSVYLSVSLSIYVYLYLCIYLTILSIYPSIYLSIYLTILSFYLSVYLSTYLCIYMSVSLSIYLSVCQCIRQSVYVCVYLCVHSALTVQRLYAICTAVHCTVFSRRPWNPFLCDQIYVPEVFMPETGEFPAVLPCRDPRCCGMLHGVISYVVTGVLEQPTWDGYVATKR